MGAGGAGVQAYSCGVQTGVSGGEAWVSAVAYTEDDDTLGIVLGQEDAGTAYALLLIGPASGGGGDGLSIGSNPIGSDARRAVLVKIDGGEVTELASEDGVGFPTGSLCKNAIGRHLSLITN